MEYGGLAQLAHEYMIRFHARSFFIGTQIASAALADPHPGSIDEKINRAMAAYFERGSGAPAIGPVTPPGGYGEAPRRGPGRPRRQPIDENHNGTGRYDENRD